MIVVVVVVMVVAVAKVKAMLLLLLPWYVDIMHLSISHRALYFFSQYPNLPAHLQAAYQALGQQALPLPPPPEAPLPPAIVC